MDLSGHPGRIQYISRIESIHLDPERIGRCDDFQSMVLDQFTNSLPIGKSHSMLESQPSDAPVKASAGEHPSSDASRQ